MRRLVAIVAGTMMAATGCTYTLADPSVRAACSPLAFEVNDHDHDPSGATRRSVVAAFERFAELIGRDVVDLGATDATHHAHAPGDPILVELTWPDEAPPYLGYAHAHVTGSVYDSGYMLLNPVVTAAPDGVVRRLVLHELGHLHGLADVDAPDELMNPDLVVDDYGRGDVWGLVLAHGGVCT